MDRSTDPSPARTNVMGTLNLLQAAREQWGDQHHTSLLSCLTDEVYGAFLGKDFYRGEPYDTAPFRQRLHPITYGHTTIPMDFLVISNRSNNYGPNQFLRS